MIAALYGKVESSGNGFVILNVNGVGFQVFVPVLAMKYLTPGTEMIKLYTHLHVREDALTLFGFPSTDELKLFETLLGVSGIGPKIAMGILSSSNVEQLVTAIASGDADLLMQIPGIGKKMASRLILELKDKIGTGWAVATINQAAPGSGEVIAALTSLGYSVMEASRAISSLPDDPNLSLEDKIKLALQYFAGK